MSTLFRFRGEFEHCLDDKGRISIPLKAREELRKSAQPEQLVASLRTEGYIALYPYEQWKLIEESVELITDIRKRDSFIRHYISTAEDLSIDKSGRILLPAKFRDALSLEHEVVILGSAHKIELWEKGNLKAQRAKDAAIAEELLTDIEVPL